MKKNVLYALFGCLFVCSTYSTNYEITTNIYTPALTLQTDDILYMTDGGFGSLTFLGYSTGKIEGTSTLVEGSGGIWQVNLANNSHFDMFDGQVHEIDISHNATAILKGGLMESIYSYQIVPDPHITLYYSGTLPLVQKINGFDYLVGNWGNGDSFSIYLHNTGYKAYGNFEFILVPEPAGLAFLALSGWLVTQQKRSHAPHSNCA